MVSNLLAICFDFGDTLVDEATEVKDQTATTLYAELIPGAESLIREIKKRGYRIALIADGRPGTYRNVLTYYHLYSLFDAVAVSEIVGVAKPDPRIFVAALDQLGISPQDYSRCVMVGNHLARDIRGANKLGMISVWIDWAPRRPKKPADQSEVPQYTIKKPLDLLDLLPVLEKRLAGKKPLFD
jgi:putative hydrolase of the HAD superfamily